jgi:LAO/AO transport system kinase
MVLMSENIEKEIQKHAVNGKISCAVARKIAEDLGVSYKEVGRAADKAGVRIKDCQLGCF